MECDIKVDIKDGEYLIFDAKSYDKDAKDAIRWLYSHFTKHWAVVYYEGTRLVIRFRNRGLNEPDTSIK